MRLVEIVSALDADPLLPSSRMVGGSWIASAGPVSPSTRLFVRAAHEGDFVVLTRLMGPAPSPAGTWTRWPHTGRKSAPRWLYVPGSARRAPRCC